MRDRPGARADPSISSASSTPPAAFHSVECAGQACLEVGPEEHTHSPSLQLALGHHEREVYEAEVITDNTKVTP